MSQISAVEMPPPIKKRRIDLPATSSASKTLAKPFKSPLRSTPSGGNTGAYPFPAQTHTPSKLATAAAASSSTANSKAFTHPTSTHSQTTNPPTPTTKPPPVTSPTINQTILHLRTTLHTLTQATTLLTASPPPDAELAALTQKWKSIARAAAEEVYATTRDRVNRMGGVGAWREREKERAGRWGGDEEEEAAAGEEESETDDDDEDGEGGAEAKEERDARRALKEESKRAREDAKVEALAEREKAKKEREEEESEKQAGNTFGGTEGRDDDTFTMGMMLRTLNIELEVLGWDGVEGRWAD